MNLDEFGESGSNFLHPKNISEGLDTKKKRSHPLNISYTMLYPPFYGSKDVFYHILSPAKLPYAFLWGRPQMRGLKLFLDRPMFRFRPLQTDR